jgi:hypothetical protein
MKTSVRAAVEVMFQRRASVSYSGSTVDKSLKHSPSLDRSSNVGLYEVIALLRSRGPLAYILIIIAETESHIRGLDDVEQGGLSIRMVAGYREAAERKILLVAEA